ncbi:hypothetical protein LA6_006172 (plasmid) [Marinibacterium anthonyi]|nr:hypothetical protein LA6_006172 [Marinibacterium anthonyi]
MSYILPQLHKVILRQHSLIGIKSNEIGDLIREILVEISTTELVRPAPVSAGPSSVDNERLDALGRELEAFKTYVQWELPKQIFRQVNHTIMTNNAEFERQMKARS